jgi:hypothetical protein
MGKRTEIEWFWCWNWGRSTVGAVTIIDLGPLMITWYAG